MIKTKVAFLKGRLLSSQSEQSEKFSKSLNWLEKSRPSKKATFVLIMVNRLFVFLHKVPKRIQILYFTLSYQLVATFSQGRSMGARGAKKTK